MTEHRSVAHLLELNGFLLDPLICHVAYSGINQDTQTRFAFTDHANIAIQSNHRLKRCAFQLSRRLHFDEKT